MKISVHYLKFCQTRKPCDITPSLFDEKRTKGWIEWNLQNYKEYGFGFHKLSLKIFPFSELCTHVKQAYKYTLQVTGKYFIIEHKNQKLWRNMGEEVVQETA